MRGSDIVPMETLHGANMIHASDEGKGGGRATLSGASFTGPNDDRATGVARLQLPGPWSRVTSRISGPHLVLPAGIAGDGQDDLVVLGQDEARRRIGRAVRLVARQEGGAGPTARRRASSSSFSTSVWSAGCTIAVVEFLAGVGLDRRQARTGHARSCSRLKVRGRRTPASASQTGPARCRVSDGAVAIARPPTIKDRLLNMSDAPRGRVPRGQL